MFFSEAVVDMDWETVDEDVEETGSLAKRPFIVRSIVLKLVGQGQCYAQMNSEGDRVDGEVKIKVEEG